MLKLPFMTLLSVLILSASAHAATLEVGGGKTFARPEDALAKAKSGDEILIYPPKDAKAYTKVALLVRTPNLTIRSADPQKRIYLDGGGFDYSGKGKIPRAIVQFDPGSDGSTLDGFFLSNARNDSFNAAGVRINQANSITIRNCYISGNDMGIMSGGDLAKSTAANQLIEACTITVNGTDKDPGYNHNLYLGGTSVTVRACEISHSTTGHNLKSRAHINWIESNYIHDSANRELDLVDAKGNTDAKNSHTVLLGNFITKAPKMSGNKTVIHFGQDGKSDHTGTLFLIHNTITTPYLSPVVDLSAPGASAIFINNLIDDSKSNQRAVLANARDGANLASVTGEGNSLAKSFLEKCPASVKNAAPAEKLPEKLPDWKTLDLPWPTKSRKTEPLFEFVSVGTLKERKPPLPAGAGTPPK